MCLIACTKVRPKIDANAVRVHRNPSEFQVPQRICKQLKPLKIFDL